MRKMFYEIGSVIIAILAMITTISLLIQCRDSNALNLEITLKGEDAEKFQEMLFDLEAIKERDAFIADVAPSIEAKATDSNFYDLIDKQKDEV